MGNRKIAFKENCSLVTVTVSSGVIVVEPHMCRQLSVF